MSRSGLRALRRLETTFAGRCARSFLALQGIDRATALSAQAFTALIPLLLLFSALSPANSRDPVSDALIRKFDLRGDAASAVHQLFARPGSGAVGVLSVVLLVLSGVSLTRRLQRMYLQAWQREPTTGIRSSLNAALGLGVLLLEIGLLSLMRTTVRALPFDWALGLPISVLAGLVLWTSVPWLLLDRRIPWRRLLPGGLLAAACVTLYGVASTIYMPLLMERYSERFGLFGVTLALIGWLLCSALIVVATTVVAAEFDRAQEPWAERLRSRLRLPSGGEPTGPGSPSSAERTPSRPGALAP